MKPHFLNLSDTSAHRTDSDLGEVLNLWDNTDLYRPKVEQHQATFHHIMARMMAITLAVHLSSDVSCHFEGLSKF